jgi:spectinomycin phosphotransferase
VKGAFEPKIHTHRKYNYTAMIEKPALPDSEITHCVQSGYGIVAKALNFLPLGNDSSAWVYRLRADDDQEYFLKLRTGPVNMPALVVPHFLRARGIQQAVAPIRTLRGEGWQPLGAFHLVLYPFIAGRSGMQGGMRDQHWHELGQVLGKIHAVRPDTSGLGEVRVETFQLAWADMVKNLQHKIDQTPFHHPLAGALANFWRSRRDEIARITTRAEDLGRRARQADLDQVLCHADIHTDNLLIEPSGALHIVDWDQPIFAPKERDLMFIPGVTETSREASLFFDGYGPAEVNSLALAYYRYEWVVQEIGDYGERVFLHLDLGEETRADAVRGFKQLFQAGDVVEEAYQADGRFE